jgi:hypothetical protein
MYYREPAFRIVEIEPVRPELYREPAKRGLLYDIPTEVVHIVPKVVGGLPNPSASMKISEDQQNAVGAFLAENGMPTCTATAIAPRVVVSAAHCQSVRRGTRFVTGRDARSPVFSAAVLAVARHPNYGGASENDFLLAYLDRDTPAVFGIGHAPSVGEAVQTVGYGRTDPELRVNSDRWWLLETVRRVDPVEFAVSAEGQHGMCMGDSGGPALLLENNKPVIVGTLSWGDRSCTGTDVYKRLDVAEPWIRDTIAAWQKSPPPPLAKAKAASVGWLVGLLAAGMLIGWAVRRGRL